MHELLPWMGEHPILTVILAYFFVWAVVNSIVALVAIFRPEVARHLSSCDCESSGGKQS